MYGFLTVGNGGRGTAVESSSSCTPTSPACRMLLSFTNAKESAHTYVGEPIRKVATAFLTVTGAST
jgi:hypothetical protein